MYLGICLHDFCKMFWENWFKPERMAQWRLENAQKVAVKVSRWFWETLGLGMNGSGGSGGKQCLDSFW